MILTSAASADAQHRLAAAVVSPVSIAVAAGVGAVVLSAGPASILSAAVLAALIGGWSTAWSP